jgi:hypothetical protein
MFNRRIALQSAASGFGYLAFSALAAQGKEKDKPLAPKAPHFPAKAKRVIFLCMDGAPSHVDTLDYKPKLNEDSGKDYSKGRRGGKLLGSSFKFAKRGQSGQYISELLPETAKCIDDIAIVNSMQTDIPNHPQAFLQMHCGLFQFPRPSLGAWVLYGLGTSNENLPGFVTLNPPPNNGGPANYGSSFLPAIYQGTKNQSTSAQRAQLDFLQSLNATALETAGQSQAIEGLIDSYELAFRMQADLPKVLDTTKESKATLARYGADSGPTAPFGKQCLIARRMIEAGVRFVEITRPGWDHHRDLANSLRNSCKSIDQPAAALLKDLKERGLLQDTLVIWGGEFGRTPTAQVGDGRDHNAKGYSIWMAGGGIKGGQTIGKTDDYGFEAVENKVHIHDWHATILALLGLDHEKLTARHAGRDFRLTDVKGRVVKELLG